MTAMVRQIGRSAIRTSGWPEARVRQLHAYHGKSHILQAVDRNGAAEEIVYLLDCNGVGHRPACKAIMALLRAQGSIACRGRQIPYLRADPMAQLRLGHVSEDRQIFPTLTNADRRP